MFIKFAVRDPPLCDHFSATSSGDHINIDPALRDESIGKMMISEKS